MITIPVWLLAIPALVIVALSAALLRALVKSEELADQRLARELYQPPVPPLNPQKAEDAGEAIDG